MTDGGGLAIGVLVIMGFAGFVLWAKTPHGKQTLAEAFGAPDIIVKKRTAPRRRAASSRAKPPASKSKTTAAKKPATAKTQKPGTPTKTGTSVRKPRS